MDAERRKAAEEIAERVKHKKRGMYARFETFLIEAALSGILHGEQRAGAELQSLVLDLNRRLVITESDLRLIASYKNMHPGNGPVFEMAAAAEHALAEIDITMLSDALASLPPPSDKTGEQRERERIVKWLREKASKYDEWDHEEGMLRTSLLGVATEIERGSK